MKEPEGCHALVTGGGTGIGAAIAEDLVRQGARLTLIGRRLEVLEKTAERLQSQGDVQVQVADVTDEAELRRAVERAREKMGPVRILVANAGAAEAAPFQRIDRAHWERMMAVNLTAVYLSVQATLPDMVKSDYGRILVVASTAGLRGYAYTAAYSAAKHGVIGLVRSLALELAGTAVTVNAVCPGFTETDMSRQAIQRISRATGRSETEAMRELTAFNPQGRLIQPDEVASAVRWLVRRQADSVTGQSIAISGGEI